MLYKHFLRKLWYYAIHNFRRFNLRSINQHRPIPKKITFIFIFLIYLQVLQNVNTVNSNNKYTKENINITNISKIKLFLFISVASKPLEGVGF